MDLQDGGNGVIVAKPLPKPRPAVRLEKGQRLLAGNACDAPQSDMLSAVPGLGRRQSTLCGCRATRHSRDGRQRGAIPPRHSTEGRRCRRSPVPIWRLAAWLALAVLQLLSIPQASAQSRGDVVQALSRGQNEAALQILAQLLDRDPDDHTLLTLQGIAMSQSGNPAKALTAYREALRRAPNFLAALQGAAEIEFQQRDSSARARLERIVSMQPENPTAYAMLGVLAFERTDCPAAVQHFAKATGALSGNRQGLWQFGQCSFQEGDWTGAAEVFRQLLNLEPGSSAVRFNLALSLFEAGEYTAAIEVAQRLAALDTPEPEVLSLLADAHLSVRQVPKALEILKRAVALHPEEERHYVDLANLCMEQEAHDLGLEILDVGIRNIPRSAPLHGMRGVLLAQLSRFDEAEAEFSRSTELDPSQTSGRIGLSMTLLQTGRHAESIPVLREQAATKPNDPVVNTLLGRALLQESGLGDAALIEAEAALDRAVRSDPSLTAAWVELGKLLIKTDRLAKAISALERAVELAPDDRQALYQLMLAARKAGQVERTRNLAERLRSLMVRDQREETQQARYQLARDVAKGN